MNLPELKQSIGAILDYNWADEMEDYSDPEHRGPEHIFVHLVKVNNWLHGLNESPDVLVGHFHMRREVPVLYVLAPIGKDQALEATAILFFCSTSCRHLVQENTEHIVKLGESSEWIDGTVCDECGTVLAN